MRKKFVIGERFGRLVVMELLPRQKAKCICDCGSETVVLRCNLRTGNTKSCGCYWVEQMAGTRTHYRSQSPEYRSWCHMKSRCDNPNTDNYDYYGGRGIRVCKRWAESFENFLADMGPRPSLDYTLNRIDNDGDYEPGNCVWSTKVDQANNRRPRNSCVRRRMSKSTSAEAPRL